MSCRAAVVQGNGNHSTLKVSQLSPQEVPGGNHSSLKAARESPEEVPRLDTQYTYQVDSEYIDRNLDRYSHSFSKTRVAQ